MQLLRIKWVRAGKRCNWFQPQQLKINYFVKILILVNPGFLI